MQDPDVPPAWSNGEQYDALGAPDHHDFSLLDFDSFEGNIDLDFGYGNGASDTNQQLGQLAEELDVQHLHGRFSPTMPQEQRNGQPGAPQSQPQDMAQAGSNNYFDFTMQPYMQNSSAFSQPHEQAYRPHGPVPPTPNSIEMHPDPTRYLQQMDAQQAMFEQRYQVRKGDTVRQQQVDNLPPD
jgi:hypothetical protein